MSLFNKDQFSCPLVCLLADALPAWLLCFDGCLYLGRVAVVPYSMHLKMFSICDNLFLYIVCICNTLEKTVQVGQTVSVGHHIPIQWYIKTTVLYRYPEDFTVWYINIRVYFIGSEHTYYILCAYVFKPHCKVFGVPKK